MNEFFPDHVARIDQQLDTVLSRDNTPATLAAAIRYSVFNGGKRIRPILAYLAAEAYGCELAKVDRAACAIELIHCYSLIHDDLPAMDNDDLRRGNPTCHIKFGEATAILAGDALQTLAFEIVASDATLDPETRIEVIKNLATAAGASGMVAGQVIDMESENKSIDADTLVRMHRCKTGDLISTSVVCGAMIARAPGEHLEALRQFGYTIGLAFQVRDDILDEVGDSSRTGKPMRGDRANRKSTFISLHGLNSATAQLDELRQEAIDLLSPLGDAAGPLRQFADFVADRDH